MAFGSIFTGDFASALLFSAAIIIAIKPLSIPNVSKSVSRLILIISTFALVITGFVFLIPADINDDVPKVVAGVVDTKDTQEDQEEFDKEKYEKEEKERQKAENERIEREEEERIANLPETKIKKIGYKSTDTDKDQWEARYDNGTAIFIYDASEESYWNNNRLFEESLKYFALIA